MSESQAYRPNAQRRDRPREEAMVDASASADTLPSTSMVESEISELPGGALLEVGFTRIRWCKVTWPNRVHELFREDVISLW